MVNWNIFAFCKTLSNSRSFKELSDVSIRVASRIVALQSSKKGGGITRFIKFLCAIIIAIDYPLYFNFLRPLPPFFFPSLSSKEAREILAWLEIEFPRTRPILLYRFFLYTRLQIFSTKISVYVVACNLSLAKLPDRVSVQLSATCHPLHTASAFLLFRFLLYHQWRLLGGLLPGQFGCTSSL